MREITTHRGVPGINDNIQILAGDRTAGGAPWQYLIGPLYMTQDGRGISAQLLFPAGASEFNEVTNETLLAVLIDRLTGFQTGPNPSRYNAIALRACEIAMLSLKERDKDAREKALREAESQVEDDGR